MLDLSRALRRLLPASIELVVDTRPTSRAVAIAPAAVEQIIMNLATNARDAMPQGGRLSISVAETRLAAGRQGSPAGDYALLAVRDSGTGIAPEIRTRLFEPFFTTKSPGAGTGLGLAMVADLVRLGRGLIDVDSEVGAGTTVRVYLPLAATDEPPAPAEPPGRSTPASDEMIRTVLVVEDEEGLRRLAERALRQRGYRVLAARDGEEGWDLFRAHRQEIALVVSDVVMPRRSGPELVAEIRRVADTPVLLTSGYSDLEADSVLAAEVPRLLKPWTAQQLVDRVRELLARPTP